MGSKSQQVPSTAPTTSPALTQQAPAPAQDAQDQVGNAALQQQSLGKLSYQAALGEMLGPKLYSAVSGQLADDKLIGHAQGAVGSATKALQTYLQGNVQADEQQAAALFVTALDGELKKAAAAAVVDTGLSAGLRDWTDTHPVEVATAAVAAAAAYILSNQDLPLVQGSKDMGGGHSVIGGIDMGRTMHLAVEQVRVGYRYQDATTQAQVIGDYYAKDGGYQISGKFDKALDADQKLGLSGLHGERNGLTTDRLDLSYTNPAMAASAYYQREKGTKDGVGKDLSVLGGRIANTAPAGELQAFARGEARSDGSWEAAGGLQKQVNDWGWSVEGYGGQNAAGQQDSGIRAGAKLRF